jgi:hypothetical protein
MNRRDARWLSPARITLIQAVTIAGAQAGDPGDPSWQGSAET